MIIALVSLSLNAILGEAGWRTLMFCGAVPALLTFFIRLFVPESQRWEQEQQRGATAHWHTRDLLGVLLGTVSALSLIAVWGFGLPWSLRILGSLVAFVLLTLGYLYPIRAYLRRWTASLGQQATPTPGKAAILGRMLLAAALSGVALLGTWGTTQSAPTWVDGLTGGTSPDPKAYTQIATALGAMLGCMLAALGGERLGRRKNVCHLVSRIDAVHPRTLPGQYGVWPPALGQCLDCGRAHGLVLRLVTLVSSGTVSNPSARHGPGFRLQLRADPGRTGRHAVAHHHERTEGWL